MSILNNTPQVVSSQHSLARVPGTVMLLISKEPHSLYLKLTIITSSLLEIYREMKDRETDHTGSGHNSQQ